MSRAAFVGRALALAISAAGVSEAALGQQDGPQAHAEAAKLISPVAADATSLSAGQKLYDAQCASCHGPTGKGNGKGGALLNPKPAGLTDAT